MMVAVIREAGMTSLTHQLQMAATQPRLSVQVTVSVGQSCAALLPYQQQLM